jgi:hypothetical protein
MTQVTCPSCNTPAPAGAIFCDNCGYDLRGVAPAAPAPAQPAYSPAPAGTIICSSCGHPNIGGSLFCEDCGAQLPQTPVAPAPPQPTYQPPAPQPAYQPPVVPGPVQPPPYQAPAAPTPSPAPSQSPPYQPPVAPYPPPAPAPAFAQSLIGRLVVAGTGASLAIPPGKQSVTIGREDPVSGIFPEIDLDPHGGQDAGVGRQHARLTLQNGQVFIEDLNSVNGTIVNKQKIVPGQPRALNNGDEVRLGKLVLNYYAS